MGSIPGRGAGLATAVHSTTQPRIVENLVMLRVGERCNILLRRETERLLRAQPYLAEASVAAFADGADGVRVEVVTVDEPSMRGSVGVSSATPWLRALSAGNRTPTTVERAGADAVARDRRVVEAYLGQAYTS